MSEVLLSLEALVVEHTTGRFPFRRRVRAVDGVNLQVHAGERVALVGPSGCGKTSLLRAACGLYRVAGGRALVLGVNPAAKRRPPTGVQLLFQDARASLHPRQTVQQALVESAKLHRPGEVGVVEEALQMTGLAHRKHALPDQLSGGEQRRVGLARLFLAQPRLTLADEPTAGLDAARKTSLLDQLLARQGPNTAFLLVTHDLAVARYACTRIVTLAEGRIVSDEPMLALLESP